MNTFSLNQIVKGQACGTFIIIGFREISGETYAQVKEYDTYSGKARRGEFALPLTALRLAA